MSRHLRLEDQEQRAVIKWADLTRLPAFPDVARGDTVGSHLYAVPNGGARSKIEASIMVGLGVRRGRPDLSLDLARNGFHGLRLELKKPRRAFTSPRAMLAAIDEEQMRCGARLLVAGYAWRVCYGADEAIVFLADYCGVRIDPTIRALAARSVGGG